MDKRIIVAIDGYSSCGKSTIAKALAKAAGYKYVDTGAMYRCVALYVLRNAPFTMDNVDEAWLLAHINDIQISFALQADGTQHTVLNGEDVESQIRTLEVGNAASQISTIGFVRKAMVAQQQAMGKDKGLVMDGRDIGTVVFPKAELKLFLTASPEIRAKRRFDELVEKGQNPDFNDVFADVKDRDYRDTHRAESPLRQAEDAVVIDNSAMTREQQMEEVLRVFRSHI
ncbi:MAG: (d)CMP kinase [Paludibacteraceae bacterium]|jgi:cytidylate kinase|nr:(d)CMP kinase [Paludibacteraceae bacterium]MBR4460725.1 (d)CMP kinase [Paludibacteraceae bacterium]MBR6145620.1 (d)CMP kinase [Paludibacteraceae bacterium]